MSRFERTALLIGENNLNKLSIAKVLVIGIGGVGGYVCESLARSGVSTMGLCDGDIVSESNINRQIIATTKTIDKLKVEVMAERIKSINPEASVTSYPFFINRDTIDKIDFSKYDYVVDAIDMVSSKLLIIEKATKLNIQIISAMGAGNKINPMLFKVSDINQTKVCPLAKVMRYELRKRGINHLKCVYSEEESSSKIKKIDENSGKQIPGSIAFVPSIMGLLISREIILDLIR